MNRFFQAAVTAGLAGLLAVSCTRKHAAADTTKLQRAFQSAEPAQTNAVQKIVTAVVNNDYPAAMATLQKLAHESKLTLDQQRATREVMTQIQQLMTEASRHPQPTNTAARPPAH